jgi:hypothetical protein
LISDWRAFIMVSASSRASCRSWLCLSTAMTDATGSPVPTGAGIHCLHVAWGVGTGAGAGVGDADCWVRCDSRKSSKGDR